MEYTAQRVAVFVLGIISVILWLTALFTKGWLILLMSYGEARVTLLGGLWGWSVCAETVATAEKVCVSIKTAGSGFIGGGSYNMPELEFATPSITLLFACLVFGLVGLVIAFCTLKDGSGVRPFRVGSEVMWIIAVCATTPVLGMMIKNNVSVSKYQMHLGNMGLSIQFPYSLFLTGLGAVVGLVAALLMFNLVRKSTKLTPPGQWVVFQNQPV